MHEGTHRYSEDSSESREKDLLMIGLRSERPRNRSSVELALKLNSSPPKVEEMDRLEALKEYSKTEAERVQV